MSSLSDCFIFVVLINTKANLIPQKWNVIKYGAFCSRTRDNWIQILKENILRQIGRDNTTILTKQDERLSSMNVSERIPGIFNTTILPDDNVGERIRSFYPSCKWRLDLLYILYI